MSEALPTIELRISGEEMNKQKGYELSTVLDSLQAFENMVTKTYLTASGKDRLSDHDKDNLKIRIVDIREGSFVSAMTILWEQTILPITPLIVENGSMIWNAITTAYEFLKVKIKAEKEGKNVEVTQTITDGGINTSIVNSHHVTIYVDPGIPDLSNKLLPEFKRISKNIDGQNIEKVEIGEANSEDGNVVIDERTKQLFSKQTLTVDQEITIIGKVVNGDFLKQKGKIQISSAPSPIEEGVVYNFTAKDRLNNEQIWQEMFLREKEYLCKYRIEMDPQNLSLTNVIEIVMIDEFEN